MKYIKKIIQDYSYIILTFFISICLYLRFCFANKFYSYIPAKAVLDPNNELLDGSSVLNYSLLNEPILNKRILTCFFQELFLKFNTNPFKILGINEPLDFGYVLIESIFFILIFYYTFKIFNLFFPNTKSLIISYLFIIVLTNFYVLPYFFTVTKNNNFLHLFDSISIFFHILCLYHLILNKKLFFVDFCLATLNRESTILIIMVYFFYILSCKDYKKFKNIFILCFLYILIETLIYLFITKMGYEYLFSRNVIKDNLLFFSDLKNFIPFLLSLSFLPILLLLFIKWIPNNFKLIPVAILIYFIALFRVGYMYEIRCLSDLMFYMYFCFIITFMNFIETKHKNSITIKQN